jgi:hypothetical protein
MKPEFTDDDPVPMDEVCAVMCWTAADNVWKRGRRNHYVTKRDMFGMMLEVRSKGETTALVRPRWRIIYCSETSTSGYTLTNNVHFKLPYFTKISADNITKTILLPSVIKEAEFVIEDRNVFARDWTLLRMFSSVWEDHRGTE